MDVGGYIGGPMGSCVWRAVQVGVCYVGNIMNNCVDILWDYGWLYGCWCKCLFLAICPGPCVDGSLGGCASVYW